MLDVSIIIPNLNSPLIAEVLAVLRHQVTALDGEAEIIVVGKDQPDLIQCDDLVNFVDTGEPVPPAVARNIGLERSRGAILCLLDADCIPEPAWLGALLGCLANGGATIVGGGVAFHRDAYWQLADNVATFYPYLATSPPGWRDLLPTLNLGFRRSVWEQVGPFDERYPRPTGEDADWTMRARLAGHHLYFLPEAAVTHHPVRATFADLWRHAVAFGEYSIKVDDRYAEVLGRPIVLRHWALILFAAPLMALWVTVRVFSDRQLWRFVHTLPAVYLSKLAWCWGATKRLRGQVAWYQNHKRGDDSV